jgi:EAL domain-containing protein (putative c-di-GMP-specific phosphodiesterase class I)/CheY-like chemotaxis protein
MSIEGPESISNVISFGRHKTRPRACVIDSKRHTRAFLKKALEDTGFAASECANHEELAAEVGRQPPRLVVHCVSPDGIESAHVLRTLSAASFQGGILLLGPRGLPALAAVQRAAEELGLEVLPPLSTPFSDESLRASVAAFLPGEEPSTSPVDVAEAVAAGWLELWYQPKINAQSLCFDSAEALVRMRHPYWGVVPPAYFIPDDSDPHLRALSEFVIGRAIDDWRHFVVDHGHVEIAINLPVDFLRDPESVDSLCRQLPNHPAFKGIIVEVNGTEVLRNLELMKEVAARVRFHNIGIAIDDLGAEWPSLLSNVGHFPFVEIKVDRKFVAGCANDRLKRSICRHILDFANSVGSRSIAEGIETREDFVCVREMGFDIVQGFLFAKPMPVLKFGKSLLSRPVTPPPWQLCGIEGLPTPDIGAVPTA